MQIHLESGTLGREELVLTFRDRVHPPHGNRSGRATASFGSALLTACQDVQRTGAFEQIVWAALTLSTLGALVLSFWL